MQRFLMLLAVAAVAGGMYVAAAPGRSSHAGPTWRQFSALQKQVAALKKSEFSVKSLATAEAVLLTTCMQTAVPVNDYGDPNGVTEGYRYTLPNPPGGEILTTALDVAPQTDAHAVWFTGGDASCGQQVSSSGLRHAAAALGLRLPHTSVHLSLEGHRP